MNYIKKLKIKNKYVLLRSDFNVPIKNNKIISDIRIKFSIPTIKFILQNNANIIIMSHLGRPIEGEYNKKFSLFNILKYIKKKIKIPVFLSKNYLNNIDIIKGVLIVLENIRFNKGEKKNNTVLSKKYSSLCEIYVMDAFGASHRIQSSTYGVGLFSNISCSGLLLKYELNCLNKIFKNPIRPITAIVGGSKISTKLKILKKLSSFVDYLFIGGGIANTLLFAQGKNIGKSLYEIKLINDAKKILKNKNIINIKDVYVGKNFLNNEISILKNVNNLENDDIILDIGKKTCENLKKILKKSKTLIWNGPIGVFEFKNFRQGTKIISKFIKFNKIFSVVGGGDTISAVNFFKIYNKISYISTGGGSFLKFLEGNELPIIKMLKKKYIKNINY